MQQVTKRDKAARVGAAARKYIRTRFSIEAITRQVVARLEAIMHERDVRGSAHDLLTRAERKQLLKLLKQGHFPVPPELAEQGAAEAAVEAQQQAAANAKNLPG